MIELISIIRQMKQGVTGPFLCEANNGQKYVAKGAKATKSGLVKEWICAHLCRGFGLPIPDFQLIYVDQLLVEYGYEDLGSGICFASEYIENIQEVTFSQQIKMSEQLLRDLFVFDYWIKNEDRSLSPLGGNPNLFIHPKTEVIYVLDHNLSFDLDFNLDRFKQGHIGTSCWDKGQNFFDKQFYEGKFSNSIATLGIAINSLPEEWLELFDLHRIEQQITVVLEKYKYADFWEGIHREQFM